MMTRWLCVVAMAMAACGGAQKTGGTTTGGDDTTSHPPDKGGEGVTGEALDDIDRAFKSKHGTINNCYSTVVNSGKLSKHTSGSVTVSTIIHTDGTVTDVKITGDDLKSPEVEACIVKVVSTWTVPGPNVQFPFSQTYSFRGE